MASGLQHTTFNRSGLVRILSETIPDPVVPKYDLGERLGQWLGFTDALALFSTLNSQTGAVLAARPGTHPTAKPLQEQLARVRQSLSESVLNDGVFSPQTPRIRFPAPLPQATVKSALDFSPYHRYYLAHQRDMGAAIGTLRTTVRSAVAKCSPSHQGLAELDAVFENALAERVRDLLATIPILLARRFTQRYEEHRAILGEAANDDPGTWAQPGSWLEAFCRDTQAVLLAELDLRLKPVVGLIASLGEAGHQTEVSKQ